MVEKVLREARPAAIRSMTSHMLRAACILCLENADDDASFLEALVQQKDPKLWYNREKFWSSQTADPKLESLVEASERRARWSTTSALLTQVPRTRPLSVSSVRNRSFSQCARPQVIVKQGYAFMIGRYYSKGYHDGDSEDTGAVSVETFIERAAAGSATISDAQSCVLHHYTKVRRLPQNEHGDAVKKSAIGSEVLSWLLSLGNEDLNSNFRDVNFRNALCWLLVLEGKEDSVWEIIQDIVSRAMQNTGESVMHRHFKAVDWTGRLLAGFAAAHLDLAPRRIADNAIKCLERLVTSRMTGVAELPLAPMTTLLGKELRRSACTACSPKAFDQFLTLIAHDEGPRRIELARARFILFHPTQATARPFLELVRTNHPELTVILCARSEARNNLSSDLMRAAYILRVEGSEHDATYLENIVQNLTPLVWHARERIWQDLQDDPKLRKAETTQRRPLPTWSASRKTRMFSTSALLHPRHSTIVTSSRSFSCAARLQATGSGSDALMLKIDRFQKAVEGGKATIEDAQQCLLELQANLMRLPLEERRLKCQELMAGGKVLRWLWDSRKADYANIYDGTNGQAFSTLHLWFLVPENLEEFVWKWLHIVANYILSSRDYTALDKQQPVNQRQEYTDFGWAHHILGALAEAHV
ncbi:hypothetical protein LTR42_006651 [Elasticomyces elasticus]|nr:hypothetical protein LTR42_006651 [Elasticomyces elasticus]